MTLALAAAANNGSGHEPGHASRFPGTSQSTIGKAMKEGRSAE
jgi:hypothetical protein